MPPIKKLALGNAKHWMVSTEIMLVVAGLLLAYLLINERKRGKISGRKKTGVNMAERVGNCERRREEK